MLDGRWAAWVWLSLGFSGCVALMFAAWTRSDSYRQDDGLGQAFGLYFAGVAAAGYPLAAALLLLLGQGLRAVFG